MLVNKMGQIELRGINKYFGKNHVLKDVSMVIERGGFTTLLGPSGCGKTTILRIIAGLEKPESGQVLIDGKEVVNAEKGVFVPSHNRGLNLVFQNYALWPHLTVKRNISFGLEIEKKDKREIKEAVDEVLARLQIQQLENRYPAELSGGQQQRVAIARAIVTKPSILLFDEPLSNLDAKLRLEMRTELKKLHRQLGCTIVYVTHDQTEALTMSTQIGIFFEGKLIQSDRPDKIYSHPSTLQVADFIGTPKINLIGGAYSFSDGTYDLSTPFGRLPAPPSVREPAEVNLALYPENILIHEQQFEGGISCKVHSVMPAGAETFVQLQMPDGELLLARQFGSCTLQEEEEVFADLQLQKCRIYNKLSGCIVKV